MIDTAGLPATFTDHVPRRHHAPVPFEMVLVPGDAAQGIKPFYSGKTEVSWDMFYDWAYGADLPPGTDATPLLDQGLRPSALYPDRPNARMGFGRRPAVGMTWQTAQAYCVWLSEKTGRTYRLPTDAEWMHILRLSGGIPADDGKLLDQAVLHDNAPHDEITLDRLTTEIATKQPNALGLHDLLGNAAEWVQPTDKGAWVRGGHFQLDADQLTPDWRAVENHNVWNSGSPQLPTDASWYVDHYYQGLRLVCEMNDAIPRGGDAE